MQELVPDPVIKAHALRHLLHIGADLFAKPGDFVDEGDLGREEGVGGVFDHLRRFQIGVEDREIAQEERAVDLAHHGLGAVRGGADDDPVGAHEIVDRRTFAQEFGVGGDVECLARRGGFDNGAHLGVGADRNGGFRDDDGVAGQRFRDLFRSRHHIGQVGVAVTAPRWRADGDEDGIRAVHGGPQIAGKLKPPRRDVLGHQHVKAGFVDRHLATGQQLDLAGVLVDADHVMAEIRKTNTGNKADIAGADHRDLHECALMQIRAPSWGEAAGTVNGAALSRRDAGGFVPVLRTIARMRRSWDQNRPGRVRASSGWADLPVTMPATISAVTGARVRPIWPWP